MANEPKFKLDKRFNGKIYRYVDDQGNHGKFHISKSPLTPLKCYVDENGVTYIIADFEKHPVSSLKELDSMNNALNNYKKSLRVYTDTPSIVLAQLDPDYHTKILEMIRISVMNSRISKKENPYALYDFITYKINKIKNEKEKAKTGIRTETGTIKAEKEN